MRQRAVWGPISAVKTKGRRTGEDWRRPASLARRRQGKSTQHTRRVTDIGGMKGSFAAASLLLSLALVGVGHLVLRALVGDWVWWSSALACEVMVLAPLCLYALLRSQDLWTRASCAAFALAALVSASTVFVAALVQVELSAGFVLFLSYLVGCAAASCALSLGVQRLQRFETLAPVSHRMSL